ncbi:MAG: serine--tRNA ligase [Myxococcota bacterium]
MLDLRTTTENLDAVKAALGRRGFEDDALFDRLATLASQRREAIGSRESLQQQRNEASQAMGRIQDKKSAEFQEKRQALKALGERVKEYEARAKDIEAELSELMLSLPNLPHESTPEGLGEAENVVVRSWGDKPAFDFAAKDHLELAEGLGAVDFERARKISGARFVVFRGVGARLRRALGAFMLDVHTEEHGYEEVGVPSLVKDASLVGTSQLPKFEADLFKVARNEALDAASGAADERRPDLYLIPTAEVPVTNLHADEILAEAELPVAYAAHTPCFRSEAGSYGKDTRGMIRVHEFQKVELVRFAHPDTALEEHAKLTAHAEVILQRLGLHYRVVELCAGDLGFGARKCFDLEVWLPGQEAYREISSCSWFGDFQARRMRARFRPEASAGGKKKPKPELLHTINGSGLALGRTVVAVLEQHQRADGSVAVPEVLRPYLGGRDVLEPAG